MERKICQLSQIEIKANGDGPGELKGYASSFANWDDVRPIPERPVKGAFQDGLSDFKRDGYIYTDHRWSFSSAIATISNAYEDDFGLAIASDFHTTDDAQRARTVATERLARGKSVSLSIGYQVLEDQFVDDPTAPGGTGRLLKKIKLLEVSLVTVPANRMALVSGAKDGTPLEVLEELALLTSAKELLETGGAFDTQALMVETAVRAFAKRAQSRFDARAKEGRVLSSANREKLGSLKTSLADVLAIIEELLAAGEPAKAADIEQLLNAEYMRFLTLEAITNGVTLT